MAGATGMAVGASPSSAPRDGRVRPSIRLSASRIRSCTVIAVMGEVDASTADDVVECVVRLLGDRKELLLDFTGVKFFAVSGYSALQRIHRECVQRGIAWNLVRSAEVTRVLRICDPTGVLHMAHDGTAASNTPGRPRRHLRLVASEQIPTSTV